MSKRFVKRGRILSFLFVFLFFILSSCNIHIEKEHRFEKTQKLAAEIAETYANVLGIDSLQYALMYQNEVVTQGTKERNVEDEISEINDLTIFGIGSVSKMFTAVSVMLLVDQGKINLDEPVTTYVTDFVMEDPRYQEITVRMLLNHSSGIMGSTFANAMLLGETSTYHHDYFLEMLSHQGLKANPGEFSVYCNDGFSLAEMVVERVSGLTLTDFIAENIAEPLGLNYTFTPQRDLDRTKMAKTYVGGEVTPTDSINLIGTGGIYSTALDLCKLGQAFMNNPKSYQAQNFLSNEAKVAMQAQEYLKGIWPEQTDSIFSYGLGWDSVDLYPFNRYGIKGIAKGGDTYLFHSSFIVLPEENLTFAVTMSGGNSTIGEIMGIAVLQQALLDLKRIEEIIPLEAIDAGLTPIPSEDLVSFSGFYIDNMNIKQIDIEANGNLTITILADELITENYQYYSSGEFINESKTKAISFVTEANNQTYLRMVQTIALPGIANVKITSYDSVKIIPSDLPEEIQQTWELRSGKYYLLSEGNKSQAFFEFVSVMLNLKTFAELTGYFSTYCIEDLFTATQTAQIPVMNGRDSGQLKFFIEDGHEYLNYVGWTFISEKDISNLLAGQDINLTIDQKGYSMWFKVTPENVGKTITVDLPESGAFAIYDNTSCLFYSTISGNQPVVLPENGKIVFISDVPGTIFTYSLE